MKESYVKPSVEVVNFSLSDYITTSGEGNGGNGGNMGTPDWED